MDTDAPERAGGLRRYAWYPFLLVSALHLLFIAIGNDLLVTVTKPALMPALLFGLLVAAPTLRSSVVLFASVALVFSWSGDVLLQSPTELAFLFGLAAFLVAHVFFIITFVKVGSGRLSAWTALYLLGYVGLIVVLAPELGSLTAPVSVYGAVLGAAAVLATRVNRLTGLGAGLFLVSDSVLAINRFASSLTIPFVDLLIMSTYIVGEGLIVFGLVTALRARHS